MNLIDHDLLQAVRRRVATACGENARHADGENRDRSLRVYRFEEQAFVVCDYQDEDTFLRLWLQVMARPVHNELFGHPVDAPVAAVFVVATGMPAHRGRGEGAKRDLCTAKHLASCLDGWLALTRQITARPTTIWVIGQHGNHGPTLWNPALHGLDEHPDEDDCLKLVDGLLRNHGATRERRKSVFEHVDQIRKESIKKGLGASDYAPASRHAVANEIAIDVMTWAYQLSVSESGMFLSDKTFDLIDHAYLQLLRFVHWVPRVEGVSPEDLLPWPSKKAIARDTLLPTTVDKNLHLIVVDDRVDIRLEASKKKEGERLAAVLEPWSGMRVTAIPSIYSGWPRGIRLSTSLLPQGTVEAGLEWERGRTALDPDVLFLDLRLWRDSLGPTEFSRECVIGAHRELAKRTGLGDDVDSFFDELALAPRVLSKIDPALPIVIFSSTQQRGVVERLQGLPNVILANCKPSLGPYPETSDPTELSRAIDAALLRARSMLPARSVWRHACDRWRASEVWDSDRFAWDGWWRRAEHRARSALFISVEPEAERHPARWFRDQWLGWALDRSPLALAAPWLFLWDWLGDTALQQITAGPVDERELNHGDEHVSRRAVAGACRVLFRAHQQFNQQWSKGQQNDGLGRMIEAAGFAFVDIMAEFAYPP